MNQRKVSPLGEKPIAPQPNRKLTIPEILGIIEHPLSHKKMEIQKRLSEQNQKEKDNPGDRFRGNVNMEVFQ